MTRDANWIPACGGTEKPFTTRTGRRLLYVWDTRSGDWQVKIRYPRKNFAF